MDLEPLEPLEPPRGAQTVADGSPIDWVRQRRRELLAHQSKEFLLPGWQGPEDGQGLFARYRRLGVDRTREILTAPDASQLVRNARLLVEACEAVILRDGTGEQLLAPGYDQPLDVRMDITLVANVDLGEYEQLVLGVFGGDEPQLCGHAADVHEWMIHLDAADGEAITGG